MSETITVEPHLSKAEKYKVLLPQVEALIKGEDNLVACTANVCAALKDAMGFLWVGFYFVVTKNSSNELVLGPFQGPVACMRIGYGMGVCGTAWKEKQTIVVKDVNDFAGHIACSALSKSEIVVPVLKNNNVVAVLDVDSDRLASFDETDKEHLEKLVTLIAPLF